MKSLRGVKYLPKEAVYDELKSPVGKLTIIASTQGLHAVLWDNDRKNPNCQKIINNLPQSNSQGTIIKTKKQLTEYFQGKRYLFNLPLVLNGTDFQVKVWEELLKISYSKTITYGEQAARIGNKNKARAVGLANGMNPISIIIPCHRVIGSHGDLVGFGGGLDKKSYLLEFEKINKKVQ